LESKINVKTIGFPTPFSEEQIDDIESVSDLYPQGMLVSICETGTVPQFIE
jgi:hypothetical protein